MSAAATNIAQTDVPIRHSQVAYAVQTTEQQPRKPQQYTLLELIEAVGEVTDNEAEIVATVRHMLASGQVKLTGNFRGEPIELICRPG